MLLAYVSALLFAHSHWRSGCVAYSLAVSIKMNVLLWAPGLLLLLIQVWFVVMYLLKNSSGTVLCVVLVIVVVE